MIHPLRINSEIGRLQTVMLHRPGKEIENLTPEHLKKLLFDDIPYLPAIQKEHDYFASALQNRGIEVLYLTKLMAETISNEENRSIFVESVLQESKENINGDYEHLKSYLNSFSNEELIDKVMAGVKKSEIEKDKKIHLYELMSDHYPFYLDPMPNLYFTRDPAAVIGNGISINRMMEGARRRETLFIDMIMKYHPRFANSNIPHWYDRTNDYSMEGGDQLVLSKEVIAIGVSARTSAQAIEKMAIDLFARQQDVKKVVAVELRKCRAFMHLDTVFTMVDHDKFTIHSEIQGPGGKMPIYILERGIEPNRVSIQERTCIKSTLEEVLGLPEILMIECGAGDPIAAAREQWNDGSNTLAIAPGVVVTYDRNEVSNECLRQNGVEVIEILSSELSRGRGGPRCMSMPILREDLS